MPRSSKAVKASWSWGQYPTRVMGPHQGEVLRQASTSRSSSGPRPMEDRGLDRRQPEEAVVEHLLEPFGVAQ